jgi:hypothetical protein
MQLLVMGIGLFKSLLVVVHTHTRPPLGCLMSLFAFPPPPLIQFAPAPGRSAHAPGSKGPQEFLLFLPYPVHDDSRGWALGVGKSATACIYLKIKGKKSKS